MAESKDNQVSPAQDADVPRPQDDVEVKEGADMNQDVKAPKVGDGGTAPPEMPQEDLDVDAKAKTVSTGPKMDSPVPQEYLDVDAKVRSTIKSILPYTKDPSNDSNSSDLESEVAGIMPMPAPSSLRRNGGGPLAISQPGAYANSTGVGRPRLVGNANTTVPPAPLEAPLPDNSGLAVAEPVDSGHFDTAEPVLPSDSQQQQERRKQQSTNTTSLIFLFVGVATLALILGLGLGFGLRDSGDEKETMAKEPQSEAEDTMLEPEKPVVEYIIDLPSYTRAALESDTDQSSPQWRAYRWLLEDPNLDSFPEWRKIQRFALATFYYSLGGEHWDLQDRWLDYTNECDWYFRELVSSVQSVGPWGDQIEGFADQIEYLDSACDSEGQYLSLIFTSNMMVGTIPREIELLKPALQFLEVGNNELVGRIPTEIGLLTQLRRFYSDWSNLHTGPIPSEIGLLTKLEELDIGYNKFTGGIPTQLGLLSNALRFLSIKRTTVTGFLPTELYLLTNLEVFFLHGNKGLTGAALLPDIRNMTKMQRFVAHDAPMRGTIPTQVGVLSNLWEFFLWRCELTGTIPSELWRLTKMLIVDLADNHLTGSLSTDLGLLSNLTHFTIKNNGLTGELPYEGIGQLGQMTNLAFAGNQFLGTIPTQVGKLTSIEFFDLEYNNLGGTIPTEFLQVGWTLETLVLHGNRDLSGTIPSELLGLANLQVLTLSNTSLTGSIPAGLCPTTQEVQETCELYYDGKLEYCGFHVFINMSCSDSLLCGCSCRECPSG